METLASLYNDHRQSCKTRARSAGAQQVDALLIHLGTAKGILDDHSYPFKVNAHFKAQVPVTSVPNCWLWIDGVNKPKLWFYSPVDYWHSVEPLPNSF